MGPPLPQNLTVSAGHAAVPAPADVRLAPTYNVETIDARDIFAHEADIRRLEAASIEPNGLGGADFLLAACRHFPEHALPAFLAIRRREPGHSGALLGLIALRGPGLVRPGGILRSWDHVFSVCGAPLVDAREAVPVIVATLRHLGGTPQGPAALCLGQINVEGRFAAALATACATLDLNLDYLSSHTRAALVLPSDRPIWNKSRRKQRRRLAATGELSLRVSTTYAETRSALERFLALEAGGWKGAAGTALLSDPAHANFTRALVWSNARQGTVHIAELVHAGTAIASVIVFIAGTWGFAWKIAHDAAFLRHSPGALLMLELTDWLAAQGALSGVDSCAGEGSLLVEPIWQHRLTIADAMVALRPATTPRYRSALARERLRRSLRARAKAIYNRIRRAQPAGV
jgi:CelD/BcsL family acetyltransferase involved in cellulose biosynthesis